MGQVYDLDLPTNEQSLLVTLADHADHHGNNVFPSNGLVAWKLGMSEDTVARLKKKLAARGILIEVKAARGHVKEYRIDLSKGEFKEPFKQRKSAHFLPSNPPQVAATSQAQPLATRTANPPQPARQPPAELCGTNHIEPSDEPSENDERSFVDEFVLLWRRAWFDFNRQKYVIVWGKDKKSAKRLIESGRTPEQLIATARFAWAKKGKGFWNCENQTDSICKFVAAFNSICKELKQTSNGAPSRAAGTTMEKRLGQYEGIGKVS